MKPRITLWLIGALLLAGSSFAQTDTASVQQTPFEKVKALMAEQFPNDVIIDTVFGKLNTDKEQDCIVILNRDVDSSKTSFERRVVFAVCKKGVFSVAAINDNLIGCSTCGMGGTQDPYISSEIIRKGTITFRSVYDGDCAKTEVTDSFSYFEHKGADRWLLETLIQIDYDCVNPKNQKKEIKSRVLTASSFGRVWFDEFEHIFMK